ncbi:PKD domain-containing protein [Flavilitoribacter nigricans]|uniref:PKD domain-containing protein n=1 Tax=Flavilitoribacter nigricans (strain ATCC 23147 / DSM 23189 / NBRC 102662 / NCIMB 1420 / SS-2) TaxID=1122177 RepID=A0A2D0MY01_FLAN2|nr:PKD domain-containing protein [Flavilitoribacter nigricans]PHN01161.1 hypothetical protein CRP01_38445 [Flavilitoribacter nigricans DSM 23189 = NBRC 102662]
MLTELTIRRAIFRYGLMLNFVFLSALSAFSQTEIGGVINQYTRVLDQPGCPNVIQVADAGSFTVGQRVLLIGMQGGQMVIEDDASFGAVSAEELTAGLYDWTHIEAIQGNEITLMDPISPGYDFSGIVQLVGVPTYADAVVTSELTPLPWDGALGGVLALEVSGTLELAADINASAMGFRGGQSVQAADDNCNLTTAFRRYFYEAGNWRGAPKGEGIIPLVPGREFGRGRQANGGGGSNSHNAGGGGGSNRTSGGNGGENREPSFFGCSGNFPGLAGFPLDYGPDRWFMGGGGGAGHRNNTSMSSGGNGGGIILIKAGELQFNTGAILSDGADGLQASGDGAGGGGSGGTIILEVDIVSGTPAVSARGGRGGNVNNQSNRCMGPGGGGSGGSVYSTSTLIEADLAGGEPGLSTGSSECPEGPNGGQSGEPGILEMAGIKMPSTAFGLEFTGLTADTVICPGDSLDLMVGISPTNLEVSYQWWVNQGGDWIELVEGNGISGTSSPNLSIDQLSVSKDFQLEINTDCTEPQRSDVIRVEVSDGPTAGFAYDLDGLTVNFINSSFGATAYQWTIEELPDYSSTEPEPEFTFPSYGSYQVQLVARSECGQDSTVQLIVFGGGPVAAFEAESSGSKCVPVTVQWIDQSEGVYDTYQWSFPGGNPSTSSEPNPVVVYEVPGEFDVTLTVSGELGTSTQTREKAVKVFSLPQPAFSYQIDGLSVSFSSTANASLTHIWSFDDGSSSNEKDPIHTFPGPGAYDVTLNLQNGGCANSVTQTVLVFTTKVEDHALRPYLQLSPNPTSGPLRLDSNHPELFPLDLYLFDARGQLLRTYELDRPRMLDLGEYPSGAYFLLGRSALGSGSWRIIKH